MGCSLTIASGVSFGLRYHKPHLYRVPHDSHQGSLDSREQPVLQPVPGELVLGTDDENIVLAGDQPRVPDPGVESGFGHLQMQFSWK